MIIVVSFIISKYKYVAGIGIYELTFKSLRHVSTQHLCSLIIIEFYLSEYNVYYLDSEKYVYCRRSITVMYLGGCRRGGCRLFTAVAAPAHARSSSIAVLLSPLEPLRVQFVPNMLCIIN